MCIIVIFTSLIVLHSLLDWQLSRGMDPAVMSALGDLVVQTASSAGLDVTATDAFIQEILELSLDATVFSTLLDDLSNNKTAVSSETFIDREMKMLRSIFDGSALVHHLEPSYYATFEKTMIMTAEEDSVV